MIVQFQRRAFSLYKCKQRCDNYCLSSSSRSAFHRLYQKYKMSTAYESNNKIPDEAKVELNPDLYPLVDRDDNIFDDYHGTKVADPYRDLENPDAVKTKDFVSKLNEISQKILNACPVREKLRKRLTALWDYEKYSCTSIRGKYFYYYYNTGLQNHSVLYQQKSLNEKGTIFIDPNTFSEDGTVALTQGKWTEDGELYAYGISEKGSDWTTIKFKKCNGDNIPDQIPGVKFSNFSFLHNNSGFFYSTYPSYKNTKDGCSTEKHEFHSIYFHKMGNHYKEDIIVYERPDNPTMMLTADVSEDGNYLFIDVSKGCDPTNQVYYYNLAAANHNVGGMLQVLPLFDKADAKYDIVDSDENSALVITNHNAPLFKLVRVELGPNAQPNPNDQWEILIEEDARRKLEWVAPVDGDKMLVCYMEDVKNTLYVHDLKTGKMLYQIPLEIGSIGGVYARKTDSRIFFSFESFLTPTIVYQADFSKCPTKESPVGISELRRVEVSGIDTNQITVKQVFYPSNDGTKIPMYIMHKKGLQNDGQNGTILYGYGGFNIADMPSFSVSRLLFVHHFGGIAASANLRGGCEYGEKWHEAGMRENKQNVFDDFIAASEYLINEKYTSTEKLVTHGGSNGGLLTAACAQQRPDLFGGVITRVGVLDMLRFHKFTIGPAWIPEYGNPDNPDDFKFLYKYSPLHCLSLKSGQQWPAMLLMSADHDDRVVPLHTLKYIAQLYYLLRTEAADWQRKPVLARIDVKAGHGAGKPTSKIIDEIVDIYSFVQQILNLNWVE